MLLFLHVVALHKIFLANFVLLGVILSEYMTEFAVNFQFHECPVFVPGQHCGKLDKIKHDLKSKFM